MSTSNSSKDLAHENGLADFWAEVSKDPEFLLEEKLNEVATDLLTLVLRSGKTRADLARALNWNASQVSKVFSGKENLTLRTIFTILQAIDYDFDVVPRPRYVSKSAQFNESELLVSLAASIDSTVKEIYATLKKTSPSSDIEDSEKWFYKDPTSAAAANMEDYNAAIAF